jgi:hypothetical protein
MPDKKKKRLIEVLISFIIINKIEEEITNCLIINDKKNIIKELLEKIKKLRISGKTDDEIPSLICIELDGKDDKLLDLIIELLKELIKRLKNNNSDNNELAKTKEKVKKVISDLVNIIEDMKSDEIENNIISKELNDLNKKNVDQLILIILKLVKIIKKLNKIKNRPRSTRKIKKTAKHQ